METFRTTFERALTAADRKQHLPFEIQVPPGTTHLDIEFTYAPPLVEDIHNLLTLTVFDPTGWRGAGHRHGGLHRITIAQDQASPGFLPGPVQAGTWTVVVDVHMVMPGPLCEMRLVVSGTDEPAGGPAPRWTAGHTASRGPGWYRGDLHAHTLHSDASWDVSGLVAFARQHQLDFTTLSDHNTISGLAEMDAACADDLLTMGGMELTTFWGHALVLGLREWVNWQIRPGERTMEDIEREVTARGGLFIIAHPKEVGDPYCTGCDWRYPEMEPGTARVVEVWNGDWVSDSNNELALKQVYTWMNEGFRLALTAGTDNHGRGKAPRRLGFNVVYAEDLTERDILRAVRAGRLYISCGPEVSLVAAAGSQQVSMGGSMDAAGEANVKLTAAWRGCPPDAVVELLVDGALDERHPAGAGGSHTWELAGSEARWVLVTLRDAGGAMLALTNPIYLDGRVSEF